MTSLVVRPDCGRECPIPRVRNLRGTLLRAGVGQASAVDWKLATDLPVPRSLYVESSRVESSRIEQLNSHLRRASNETALVGRQLLRLRLRPTFRSNLRPTLRLMLRPTLWPTLWPTLRDTLWATMSPRLRLTLCPTLRLTLWPTLRPKAVQSRCCALQLAETNS